MQKAQIFDLVKGDFDSVNTLITEQLHSDVPLVETIGKYIINSGGKRLRPLLVILTAQTLTARSPASAPSTQLATVIEFLHTATLLHDDVVDTSSLRRGNATANARWGNAPSVLVGDFLYSRAFQLMVQIGNLDVMSVLADATNVIAEGEVLQLSNCKNPDLSESDYLEVITAKTAKLFEAATHSAALLSGADAVTCEAMAEYGKLLGVAFQLADDVLDYTGDPETMGKNIGDDLAEGKSTLPLIEAQKRVPQGDREFIRKAIRSGDLGAIDPLLKLIRDCGALDYTQQKAVEYARAAREKLDTLDQDSPHRQALLSLTEIAVNRNH